MSSDFRVHVTNPERAKTFEKVFGRTVVPVTSFIPLRANLPGMPAHPVYLLDLARITPEERARLVAHLAERFGTSPADVERGLDALGCPILAEDCIAMGLDFRQVL